MAQAPKNTTSDLNAEVSKQMEVLRDDIAKLTETVAEYGKAQNAQLKAAASSKAADLVDSGSAAAEAIKSQVDKTYSDAEEAVRTNPSAAIGIAAAVGFVVGMISARR